MKCKYKDEEIKTLYSEGNNLVDIAKVVNINRKALSVYLKRCGIHIRPHPDRSRTKIYPFNIDYFKNIDTRDKAYFLGLMYADGNVYLKGKTSQITLQNEDSYILEKFKEYLSYKGPLYNDRDRYLKLMIHDKTMMNHLIDKGCIPRKSLVLRFPSRDQVPEYLLSHFVRGFFDGDGCIHDKKDGRNKVVSFTSTKDFLMVLNNELNKIGIGDKSFCIRYKEKENSCGSMYIHPKKEIQILERYLYNEAKDLYLTRKKSKFEYASK